MIPPVVNRLISVRELRAVAIKHLGELSVEHEFFCHFFSKRKTCHEYPQHMFLWRNKKNYPTIMTKYSSVASHLNITI